MRHALELKIRRGATTVPNAQHLDTVLYYATNDDEWRPRNRKHSRVSIFLDGPPSEGILAQEAFNRSTLQQRVPRALGKYRFIISPEPDEVGSTLLT